MTTTDLDGRVAVVTGAGRGLGRAEALELAGRGARVVVNDHDGGPANDVASEITARGGQAVAFKGDVADMDHAGGMVALAVEQFGSLDILVNNAGILRDRMVFSMSEDEWDAVIRVHLRGTFAPMRFAAEHWREQAKAGVDVDARIVNTSSTSGLFANPGQSNYGAAKSGIATLSIIASKELGRYGVRVNAIAPGARTRMTENLGNGRPAPEPGEWDPRSPDNVAPLVTWLASAESADVTGQVFLVGGGRITVAHGWARGPAQDKGARWDPAELGPVVTGLLAAAEPAVT